MPRSLIGRAPRPDLPVDCLRRVTEQGEIVAEQAFRRYPSGVCRYVHGGEHMAGRIAQRYRHAAHTNLEFLVEQAPSLLADLLESQPEPMLVRDRHWRQSLHLYLAEVVVE